MTEVVHIVQVAPEIVMSEEKLKLYQNETQNDEVFNLVVEHYYKGWPRNINKKVIGDIKHFYNIINDITIDKKIIFF